MGTSVFPWVFVRSHWRRPPYSFGVGKKTVQVVAHYRRWPGWAKRIGWLI